MHNNTISKPTLAVVGVVVGVAVGVVVGAVVGVAVGVGVVSLKLLQIRSPKALMVVSSHSAAVTQVLLEA